MSKSGIIIRQKGDFGDAEKFLKRSVKLNRRVLSVLRSFGEIGLEELKEATPKRTGKTSRSWTYKTEARKGAYSLSFQNTNVFGGVPIVVLIVYGHATPSGRWIEG